MASAKQVAANRRNAKLPRGPLSEAASAAIRENAVKHGLTAKHVVMQHEDDADYHELRASITMEYQPRTPQEHRLADQIAQNYWRLLRCRRVETATFENRLGTLKDRLKIDPKAGFVVSLRPPGRGRRSEPAARRSYRIALFQHGCVSGCEDPAFRHRTAHDGAPTRIMEPGLHGIQAIFHPRKSWTGNSSRCL